MQRSSFAQAQAMYKLLLVVAEADVCHVLNLNTTMVRSRPDDEQSSHADDDHAGTKASIPSDMLAAS